jgi:hypothetical protein
MGKLNGKFKAFLIILCIACAAIFLVIFLGGKNGTGPDPVSVSQSGAEAVITADADVTGINDPSQLSVQDSEPDPAPVNEAVYLGIRDYGLDGINKDNIDNFIYLFEINGEEYEYRIPDGDPDYPIQNALKEGYHYDLTEEDGMVISVEEITKRTSLYDPPVAGVPGERTLTNYLETALMPVGTTLYVYGGGWDWQDEGSSIQTRTLGVSQDWVDFFNCHDVDYTYRDPDNDPSKADPATSYYPYGGFNEYYYAGLDCSGYIGWVLYNTFETADGLPGYVGSSTRIARTLSDYGFGEWTQDIRMPAPGNGYEMKPGDVMSINGHVWISLGTCDDGSVVILHSAPSRSRTGQPGGGVQISAVGYSGCEAYMLVDHYMSEYYPEWYERYAVYLCPPDLFFPFEGDYAGRFTWDITGDDEGLKDPDGLQDMDPEEVLFILFNEE